MGQQSFQYGMTLPDLETGKYQIEHCIYKRVWEVRTYPFPIPNVNWYPTPTPDPRWSFEIDK